jgi:ureidoacrylate peracid hydrolase
MMSLDSIPQEIKDRVTYRRNGTVSILDKVDPSKTALIVIDMQNYFWMEDLSVLYTPEAAGIVDNINALTQSARAVDIPTYWVQHTFTEGWKSWYEKTTKGSVAREMIANTAPGSYGYEIHECMDVRQEDTRVKKSRYSAMLPNSSDLDRLLRERGIDTLIITGALTNCCCESTARDAMMMDYDVVFVSDANATRSEQQHQATLVSMMQLFADVRDTNATISLLSAKTAAAL